MFNNQLSASYTGPGVWLIFRGNQPTEKSSPWGVIYSKNTVTGWIHVSESWSPRTPECDLIWRYGLPRGRQVQMRSLGWVLIQHAWHLIQRGNLDTDTHRKGRQYEENPGRRRPSTAKERGRSREFPHSLRRNRSCWHPVLDFSLQNCEATHSCCLKHPLWGTLLQQL